MTRKTGIPLWGAAAAWLVNGKLCAGKLLGPLPQNKSCNQEVGKKKEGKKGWLAHQPWSPPVRMCHKYSIKICSCKAVGATEWEQQKNGVFLSHVGVLRSVLWEDTKRGMLNCLEYTCKKIHITTTYLKRTCINISSFLSIYLNKLSLTF